MLMSYSKFQSWLEGAGLLFVDPNQITPLSSFVPGRLAMSDDIRHVRNINYGGDKKRAMIWHDGDHPRVIKGVSKLREDEDGLSWTLVDVNNVPYRISIWWDKKHLEMKQKFIEARDPYHAKVVSRLAYIYQGKEPELAVESSVESWTQEGKP